MPNFSEEDTTFFLLYPSIRIAEDLTQASQAYLGCINFLGKTAGREVDTGTEEVAIRRGGRNRPLSPGPRIIGFPWFHAEPPPEEDRLSSGDTSFPKG